MISVRAYTATQPVLDAPHNDLRRAGAGAFNLIPTVTGGARAIGTALPEQKGKLGAIPIKAPVPVGAIVGRLQ